MGDPRAPILDFLNAARIAGVAVSPDDALAAFAALELLGYADRQTLQTALRIVLAKSNLERERFDDAFARFFSADPDPFARSDASTSRVGDFEDPPEIAAAIAGSELARTLIADDRARLVLDLQAAARDADIASIAFFTQTNLFTRRILDRLDLAALENAIGRLRASNDPRARAAAEFLRDRERAVRELARDIVERRLARRGGERSRERDDFLRDARVSNLDPRDRARMFELVREMARRLATRAGRARRDRRRGPLDARDTLRANMAHGGILLTPVFKRRRVERPRVVILCDVSGSVAAIARFLLLFVQSLSVELADIRSFAFSGPLVEVTEIVRRTTIDDALAQIVRLVGFRSSDYGRAFTDFTDGFGEIVDGKTTVVVLGDGRTNFADPRLDLVAGIARRAKRFLWFNPEQRVAWGTDDSEMLRYAPLCTLATTCNRLRHLEAIVDDLIRIA